MTVPMTDKELKAECTRLRVVLAHAVRSEDRLFKLSLAAQSGNQAVFARVSLQHKSAAEETQRVRTVLNAIENKLQ